MHGVFTLIGTAISLGLNGLIQQKLQHTGGICLGRSTFFVKIISPFSKGHFKSTLPSWSQRSAVCLIKVINPYLTTKSTFAPCSTRLCKVPFASIVSVLPLSPDSQY